jgi:hypothetical protein
MIERVSNDERFWLADLSSVDTPEARQAAMIKGSPLVGSL